MRRIGLALSGNLPLRAAVGHVRAAEASGFETFWMHETYFQRDAISFLAAAACQVERIGLAPGCVGPYTRHPAVLAMTMATLAETAPGPVLLGIGAGNPDRLVEIGYERRQLAAEGVREAIDVCRGLWTGEPLAYHGRHFEIPGVRLLAPPPRRPIPIYVAGWSARLLRVCGECGDGYLARPGEPVERLAQLIGRVRAAAAAAGRDPDALETAANLLCSVDDDEGRARDAARADPFVLYLFSSSQSEVLDPEWKARLGELLRRGERGAAARMVSDEQLDGFTVCGTPGQVALRLDRFCAAGVGQPVLQPLSPEAGAIEACLRAGRLYAGRGAS